MNFYTQVFLKKLYNSRKFPDLSNKVIIVSQLFHLNELEIATWSLWLERLNWEVGNLPLEVFLFVTGAQVKAFLNPEIEMDVYFKKLGQDFPKVRKAYRVWTKKESNRLSLSAVDINRQYKKLKQVLLFPFIVCFNMYSQRIRRN